MSCDISKLLKKVRVVIKDNGGTIEGAITSKNAIEVMLKELQSQPKGSIGVVGRAAKLVSELPKEAKTTTADSEGTVLEPTYRGTRGLTIHSGGAYGADTIFGVLGNLLGATVKHYRARSLPKVSNTLTREGVIATVVSAEEMKLAYDMAAEITGKRMKVSSVNDLKARNIVQVINADQVVAAVTKLVGGKVTGGTKGAVEAGVKLGKPVYVYSTVEDVWYKAQANGTMEVIAADKIVLSGNITGIGTRDLGLYSVKDDVTGKWTPRKQYVGAELELQATKAIFEVLAKKLGVTQKYEEVVKSGVKAGVQNVYYSTGELKELSNLALRQFVYKGTEFHSVEHAYQSLKSGKLVPEVYENEGWYSGGVIAARSKVTEKKGSIALMEALVTESFKQNPSSMKVLKSTGKDILTHTQDKGIWAKEFPRILMRVRDAKVLNEYVPKQETYPDILVISGSNSTRVAAHKAHKGVLVMRGAGAIDGIVNMNEKFHFGNPFIVGSVSKKNTWTGPEVSQMFSDWLDGTDNQQVEPERRAWINELISEGRLDGQKLIYFKNETAATHVKVLVDKVAARKNPKVTVVSPKGRAGKYTLQGGKFEANKSQSALIDTTVSMLSKKSSKVQDNVLIIQGEGGSGKSTAIGKAIEVANESDLWMFQGVAITHTAKDVLESMSEFIDPNTRFRTSTVASLLKTMSKLNDKNSMMLPSGVLFNKFSSVAGGHAKSMTSEVVPTPGGIIPTVIVVDEVSMLPDRELRTLLGLVSFHKGKLKLILMGDYHQLPVIGSKAVNKVSTTLVGFSGENSILDSNKWLKENAQGIEHFQLEGQNRQGVDSELYNVIGKVGNKVDDMLGRAQAFTISDSVKDDGTVATVGLDVAISEAFADGPKSSAKFLAFNHKTVVRAIKDIREFLFKDKEEVVYHIGEEQIMVYANEAMGGPPVYTNGLQVTVTAVGEPFIATDNLLVVRDTPTGYSKQTVDVNWKDGTELEELVFYSEEKKEKFTIIVPVNMGSKVLEYAGNNDVDVIEAYLEVINQVTTVTTKGGTFKIKKVSDLSEEGRGRSLSLVPFGYAYGMTTYKAQGHTINNVIYDSSFTVHKSAKNPLFVQATSEYTAVSRAKKKLYLVGNARTRYTTNTTDDDDKVGIPGVDDDDVGTDTNTDTDPKIDIGGHPVVVQDEYFDREAVKADTGRVYLFGDNSADRASGHVPKSTQSVVRGLDNTIGIDTKVNRAKSYNSYMRDKYLAQYKIHLTQVRTDIAKAQAEGKVIVLPKDGIGTGAAYLQKNAPKLYAELASMLNELAGYEYMKLKATKRKKVKPIVVEPDAYKRFVRDIEAFAIKTKKSLKVRNRRGTQLLWAVWDKEQSLGHYDNGQVELNDVTLAKAQIDKLGTDKEYATAYNKYVDARIKFLTSEISKANTGSLRESFFKNLLTSTKDELKKIGTKDVAAHRADALSKIETMATRDESNSTAAHEYIHTITVDLINKVQDEMRLGIVDSAKEHKLVADLEKLYEEASDAYMEAGDNSAIVTSNPMADGKPYWSLDLKEFVAETLSRPKLLEELNTVSSSVVVDGGFIGKFIDIVTRMLEGVMGVKLREGSVAHAITATVSEIAKIDKDIDPNQAPSNMKVGSIMEINAMQEELNKDCG